MDVPILFDGHSEGSSVEQDIATLNSMQIGGPFDAPDTVTLDGAVPLRGLTWVINGIEWGDEVYWEQNGSNGQPYRTRQDAVVHLIHYTREERVKIQATNTLPNIYVVSNGGETMRSIAKSMYGNASKWKQIREANPNIRDPNKIKIGTKVRVP